MKIFDRLILIIYSIIIAATALVFIVLPFNFPEILSIDLVLNFINNLRGNYIYSLFAAVILIFSIIYLISLFKLNKRKSSGSYLALRNEYGEIVIYKETIIGLVDSIATKFSGINNIKTNVHFSEGQVHLFLKGQASNEVNIPEISKELQIKVKEHIENTTGSQVDQIKVEIVSVTTPMNRVK